MSILSQQQAYLWGALYAKDQTNKIKILYENQDFLVSYAKELGCPTSFLSKKKSGKILTYLEIDLSGHPELIVTENLPSLDPELEYHFIRGWFETRGSLFLCQGNYGWKLGGPKELLLQVSQIIERHTSLKVNKISDVLRYYGNQQIELVLDWLYQDATWYDSHKYQLYQDLVKLNEVNAKIWMSEEEEKFSIEQYLAGKSPYYISGVLNRKSSTISRCLEKNNIPIREYYYQYKNENLFENINNENSAYFLGLLYADGNINKKNNDIKLGLIDKDLVEKFAKVLYGFEWERSIKYTSQEFLEENEKIFYRVNFVSEKMKQDLSKWGCTPNKCFEIKYPDFLRSDLEHHFIRGYLDGDGCICLTGSKSLVDFTSNPDFIHGLRNRLIELGFQPNSVQYKDNSASFHMSSWQGNIDFLDWLYYDATVYMDRKYNKYLEVKEIWKQKQIKKGINYAKS